MKKILNLACLMTLFIGCGNEVKAEQCPSWQTVKERNINYLILQSNDDIIIKGMTINRGNCAYANKYLDFGEFDSSFNPLSEEHRQEIEAHNKWVEAWVKTAKQIPIIKYKNGKDVWSEEKILQMLYYASTRARIYTFGTSKKKTEDEKFFEELDELSKGAFLTDSYLIGETFSFGNKIYFMIGCNYKDVIEVRLETNLGECVLPINR